MFCKHAKSQCYQFFCHVPHKQFSLFWLESQGNKISSVMHIGSRHLCGTNSWSLTQYLSSLKWSVSSVVVVAEEGMWAFGPLLFVARMVASSVVLSHALSILEVGGTLLTFD